MAERDESASVEEEREHGGKTAQKPGDGKPGSGLGKKAKDKKTAILVVLTAAGVLIAWLSLRKNSSSSSGSSGPGLASSAGNAANYPTSNGDVAGYGSNQYGFDPNAYQGLQTMIGNLSTQLTGLQGTVTGIQNQLPKSGSSGTTAGAHTLAAQIAGLHKNLGIENQQILTARGHIKSAKTPTERKKWTDIGNYWHHRKDATLAKLHSLGG